ncbi:MAG: molecular chaperone HtpG [Deltaproteobacteria bacterium]|nr:molecular chaperone HtpG [Deltaproteobacteria bacterium]MBW2254506.1 molecular chaperone HtpG [Deltaproteobacteria bacterium]
MSTIEHGFKAEVRQLLDLMVHSVYSDQQVFLRELVSNSTDALDRVRFLALTRDDLVPAQEDEPGVRITIDEEARSLTIDDDGIGMTEVEVVENLGTIAHSGSKAFLEALKDKPEDAPKFIGQFGVGFYSCFMVAEEVVVETRSALPGQKPVVWRSDGKGTYTVDIGDRAHRGTRVTVKLHEEAAEFAHAARVRHVITRYSNFLPWPIAVDGEQANSAKTLWLEPPSQVTDEEANEFYKSITLDWRDPALKIHVSVDSPLQYSALLFVPSERPWDLFHPEADRGPRLYARRVLITEHARDLLPDWLRFLRGVVSGEDISLNVSREMIQKTPALRKIRNALTTRILKELAKVANSEAPDGEAHPYASLWNDFGVVLKEGYYREADDLRERLVPLLRFNALSHDDEEGLLSLADYRNAMPEGQDAIWYLTGATRADALSSPHLEAFRNRGWDVLLFTDPIDEWVAATLTEYDGVPVKSVSRGEISLEDEAEGEKADLSVLTPWLEELYGDAVAGVRSSGRLTDTACVLVDDEEGLSANMERLLRQSAPGEVPAARRFLELNSRHPLIKNLARLKEEGRAEAAQSIGRLLLDDALLLEGTVYEPAEMGRRLQALLEQAAATAVAGPPPAESE